MESKGKEELFWEALFGKKKPDSSQPGPEPGTSGLFGGSFGSKQHDQKEVVVLEQRRDQLQQPAADNDQPEDDSIWRMLARQANLEDAIELREQQQQQKQQQQHQQQKATNVKDAVARLEVLQPGNYLFVVWDAQVWMEEETQSSHICQLVATLPQVGGDFRCYIHPDVVRGTPNYPFQHVKNKHWLLDSRMTSASRYKNHLLLPAENPLPTFQALDKFLKFLEESCQRVRPFYEGVVLFCYDQELMQQLAKTFTRNPKLKSRIHAVVKGMGALTSYLAETIPDKFKVGRVILNFGIQVSIVM